MATPSPVAMVLGVGALLFLMKGGEEEDEPKDLPGLEDDPDNGKSDEGKSDGDEPDNGSGGDEPDNGGGGDESDNGGGGDEPDNGGGGDEPDNGGSISAQEAFDALSYKIKGTGKTEEVTVSDVPDGFGHGDLYVSEDCSVAIIGRDWEPMVLANDRTYSPEEWYAEYGSGKRPTDQGAAQMDISVALDYTNRILFGHTCYDKVPHKEDYQTRIDYDNAWSHFLMTQRALSGAFFEIYYERVTPPMMDAWGDADPDGHAEYMIEQVVDVVFEDHPTLSSVNDLTGIAYERITKEDPDAPEVIDPQNTAHDEYKELWLAIRDVVAKHA